MLAYNHERYIERAVRSALLQKADFDFEIVVGEDCSTDATRTILRRLAPESSARLRVLEWETNYGMQRNFAAAFSESAGQYV
ncbi:MAG TPA: glycosyltransferase, partial [Pirellulales bacterium]|nr:glycosyltransferase [Pirellulales bacterium]